MGADWAGAAASAGTAGAPAWELPPGLAPFVRESPAPAPRRFPRLLPPAHALRQLDCLPVPVGVRNVKRAVPMVKGMALGVANPPADVLGVVRIGAERYGHFGAAEAIEQLPGGVIVPHGFAQTRRGDLGLMSFADASSLWGLSESTLCKAVANGKIVPGLDARKYVASNGSYRVRDG